MPFVRGGLAIAIAAGFQLTGPAGPGAGEETPRAAAAPRTDHALGVYDERLQRVVLIGGAGDPGPGTKDAVWSWSGTRWDAVSADGPPGRVNAGAAWAVRAAQTVVAGGARKDAAGTAWQIVGDVWIGGPPGWQPLMDVTPRDHHALVADGRGGVLMFGGIPADRAAPWPTDTWILGDDGWTRVATEGPAARGRTALAYDSRRHQVVLFGGVGQPPGPRQPQTFFGDTWTWDGTRWQQVATSGPPGRYAHAMVFDERAKVTLMYGGAAAHQGAPLGDMWRWDGTRWQEIPLRGPTPGHRYQPVMVYDRARGRTLLHGGIGGAADTWEWDGEQWRRVAVSP